MDSADINEICLMGFLLCGVPLKCFKNAELSIEYRTTLIGTNSSGKTNAIEGIMILSEIVTVMDLTTIIDGSKNNNGGVGGGAY